MFSYIGTVHKPFSCSGHTFAIFRFSRGTVNHLGLSLTWANYKIQHLF